VTLLKLEQSLRNEATAGLERLRMAPLAPGDESTRLRFLLDMQARLDAIEQRGRQPSADKGGS
jgi:hypothetical protein